MSYLIFNFDGTWNGHDDEYQTNVKKFHKAVSTGDQHSFYFEGPGNDESNFISHYLGGAIGLGCRSIRDQALDVFDHNYTGCNQIAVIGFSRGAAIARMFCHKLAQKNIEVDFLGCFDTVFARLPFGRFQRDTLFGDLHVSPKVKYARHAVALDEDRASFEPNLMNARAGIKEVWFTGNHTDVGGGYKDGGLADVTLHWMAQEAVERGGLSFGTLPTKQPLNAPHRENMPGRRRRRRVGVKVNDKWSDRLPEIYEYT
jgi:uncharacterized protein (DUF2235 family)